MRIKQLNLLVPELLPAQNELSDTNKEKVLLSLKIALQSLDVDSPERARSQVDRALIVLNPTDIINTDFYTQDAHNHRGTLDYDEYFNIKHVKSKQPEICLVKSVLVAYQCFLLLCNETSKLNLENIKIQRQGFRNYFQLLSRVFNLSLN